MRLLNIFALCVLLVACGGGGGGNDGRVSPACVPHAGPVVVQMFGDSTQEGYETTPAGNVIVAHNPAADLQVFFTARHGAGKVIVSSRARNGITAQQRAAGTDALNAPWPGSVNADIVIVNHGINDMQLGDLAAYKAALGKLAHASVAQVIFETQNDTYAYDGGPYAQAMRDVAATNGLVVADTYAFTVDKLPLLSDWAHPTDALYAQISAQVVQPAVAPAVARLLCE